MEHLRILSRQIEEDTAAFLASGGQIQQIPMGHIVMVDDIAPSKKRHTLESGINGSRMAVNNGRRKTME